LKGSESDALTLTFAYLVAGRDVDTLVRKAENLITHKENFENKIGTSSPFQAVKFPAPLEDALGGDARRLRQAMQTSYTKVMSGGDGGGEGGAVSALQMQATIPINYMRFLSPKNGPREFYTGGTPSRAGREGMLYVLCDKKESDLFIKTVKEFAPPNNFFDELFYVSNIDSDFKGTEPRKSGSLDNCLILSAEKKFEKEMLPTLHKVANSIAGEELRPYKFVDGTIVKGDMVVHMNKNMTKCILWLGSKPITLKKDDEEALKKMGVADIDTTFTK
jgi:hypothetical protein